MSVRLTKPWLRADADRLARLPGQLGVFELADESGEVLMIGVADARTLFGLRSAIAAALESVPASAFRYEVTSAYQTRWRELLMAYVADHGKVPRHGDVPPNLGRLSPG